MEDDILHKIKKVASHFRNIKIRNDKNIKEEKEIQDILDELWDMIRSKNETGISKRQD